MSLSLKKVAKLKSKIYMGLFIHCYHHPMCWLREGAERETSRKNITRFVSVKTQRITIFIIITRPKPAYGRQGLAGSWGQDTDEVSTFLVFLTSHFAPVALSSD